MPLRKDGCACRGSVMYAPGIERTTNRGLRKCALTTHLALSFRGRFTRLSHDVYPVGLVQEAASPDSAIRVTRTGEEIIFVPCGECHP